MMETTGAGSVELECELEGIDLPSGDYELGDGIELSIVPADRRGKLKFEFERYTVGFAICFSFERTLGVVSWSALAKSMYACCDANVRCYRCLAMLH
jgi:hypothetical protein